jgi:hypothetical protein
VETVADGNVAQVESLAMAASPAVPLAAVVVPTEKKPSAWLTVFSAVPSGYGSPTRKVNAPSSVSSYILLPVWVPLLL